MSRGKHQILDNDNDCLCPDTFLVRHVFAFEFDSLKSMVVLQVFDVDGPAVLGYVIFRQSGGLVAAQKLCSIPQVVLPIPTEKIDENLLTKSTFKYLLPQGCHGRNTFKT